MWDLIAMSRTSPGRACSFAIVNAWVASNCSCRSSTGATARRGCRSSRAAGGRNVGCPKADAPSIDLHKILDLAFQNVLHGRSASRTSGVKVAEDGSVIEASQCYFQATHGRSWPPVFASPSLGGSRRTANRGMKAGSA